MRRTKTGAIFGPPCATHFMAKIRMRLGLGVCVLCKFIINMIVIILLLLFLVPLLVLSNSLASNILPQNQGPTQLTGREVKFGR